MNKIDTKYINYTQGQSEDRMPSPVIDPKECSIDGSDAPVFCETDDEWDFEEQIFVPQSNVVVRSGVEEVSEASAPGAAAVLVPQVAENARSPQRFGRTYSHQEGEVSWMSGIIARMRCHPPGGKDLSCCSIGLGELGNIISTISAEHRRVGVKITLGDLVRTYGPRRA